ncbi:hypothetical protein [Acidithiobacillus ferrooxidans]|uniref:hypothetical protein n=1 Tax=Acidithiobacillus ferrooxidans TaxID=920 RepID=UPI001D0061FA|nr:hypothetical protein [Acidithiobacillus ferrooxidans]
MGVFGSFRKGVFRGFRERPGGAKTIAFQDQSALNCRREGYDGVVCGHIHHAEIKAMEGIMYYKRWRLGGNLHGTH